MTTAVLDRPPGPTIAARRPPLARLTGLEIRKSLSTRSGRTLVGAASVLPAVGAGTMFALGEQPPNAAMLLAVLGSLVGMLLVAVGVLSTAGEWTHGTAQTTFLTVPQRGRVLTAKYAGMALLGAVIATVVVGTTFATAAVGTDAGFSWQGAGVATVATTAGGAALTVVGARHRRRGGQRAGRADRDLPGAARRDQHPERGEAGVGEERRPAGGDLRPDRPERREPAVRGAGRLGAGEHDRRRRCHPPPGDLLKTSGTAGRLLGAGPRCLT